MLDRLISYYENNTIYGSWLFVGKKGVGKFKTARDLAFHILAKEYGEQAKATFNNHPALKIVQRDITETDKKELDKLFNSKKGEVVTEERINQSKKNKSIKIEQIRELIEHISLTSSSQSRIIIIDSINELNANAANALLKTLEEPPAKTIIILICHNPDTVLSTIRSRCRVLRFKPCSDKQITEFLSARYPDLSENEMKITAFYADGAIGAAVNFIENDGLDIYRSFQDVIENFPSISYAAVNKTVNDLTDEKKKDETKIEIFKNFILLTLAARAGRGFSEENIRFYERAASMLKDSELPLNIDLKQTLTAILSGNI